MAFQLHSPYAPAGDQPQAIDELVAGLRAGEAAPDAARRDRLRQDLHDRQRDRAVGPAHAGRFRTTRRWRPSCTPSSSSSSPRTRSATSSATTTTTSPRPTSRRRTRTSPRTPASTTTSTGCGCRRRPCCSSADDVVIVASVSCIYGLGTPEDWRGMRIDMRAGAPLRRRDLLRADGGDPVHAQRGRAAARPVSRARRRGRGAARVRGLLGPDRARGRRRLAHLGGGPGDGQDGARHGPAGALPGEALRDTRGPAARRARHDPRGAARAAGDASAPRASCSRRSDCSSAPSTTSSCSPAWAAARAWRTIRVTSRAARPASGRAACWISFPRAPTARRTSCWWLTSRTSPCSQIGAMYEGDRSRKTTLVDFGFRLPSALDNRPLRFDEFERQVGPTINVSATPGEYELRKSGGVIVEQIIRPTGLVDPELLDPPDRGPGGRPARRGARARAAKGARARDHAHEAHGGGPDRLPGRDGRARALPAQRHRRARARRDPARAAARRLRRARGHQPAARRARPARGVARRDPRRRQGRVPAQRAIAHPDGGPRRAQRGRARHLLRRQDDRLDEARDRAR